MKALYLDGRQGLDVLLDGPALRVRGAGRADGRYPLSRISRVVTLGDVGWAGRALLACFHLQIPIAVLDNAGRFVRLRFPLDGAGDGLARHMGELLAIPRYRRRYHIWLRATEEREMRGAASEVGLTGHHFSRERLWATIYAAQSGARSRRLGRHYRLLRGLAVAHVASLFSRIGLPRNPEIWNPQEYRLLNDIVRLEEWRHVGFVGRLVARSARDDLRRALIHAFESLSEERSRRLAAWRQGLLFELMGVRLGRELDSDELCSVPLDKPVECTTPMLAQLCETALGAIGGNSALVPRAPKDSLRTSVKILKAWLDYDRRAHEHF